MIYCGCLRRGYTETKDRGICPHDGCLHGVYEETKDHSGFQRGSLTETMDYGGCMPCGYKKTMDYGIGCLRDGYTKIMQGSEWVHPTITIPYH